MNQICVLILETNTAHNVKQVIPTFLTFPAEYENNENVVDNCQAQGDQEIEGPETALSELGGDKR